VRAAALDAAPISCFICYPFVAPAVAWAVSLWPGTHWLSVLRLLDLRMDFIHILRL
jgi:hypothetical protein